MFTKKLVSGSKSKRPGLDKAIEIARSRDTIIFWRLDRLGCNMEDLITLVKELNERIIIKWIVKSNTLCYNSGLWVMKIIPCLSHKCW